MTHDARDEAKQTRPKGIICPKCGRQEWRVRDTDNIVGGVRRYRKCLNCKRVIVTVEKTGR